MELFRSGAGAVCEILFGERAVILDSCYFSTLQSSMLVDLARVSEQSCALSCTFYHLASATVRCRDSSVLACKVQVFCMLRALLRGEFWKEKVRLDQLPCAFIVTGGSRFGYLKYLLVSNCKY